MWMGADGDQEGRGDKCDASGDEGWVSGDEGWNVDQDRAYWRRRFFILCGGVAALGVCAWLFPGAHQPSAGTVAATRASVAALVARQALPSVAYGRAWSVPKATGQAPVSKAAGEASPAPLATPSVKPANPGKAQKASTVNHPSPVASAACAPADIVLSLFTSQSRYARGARPKFSVYAVSTSAATCVQPYGAGSVQVVVTRQGHVVWDSAACKAPAAKPVRFTLGVPQVLTMVWNPRGAGPAGCAGSLPADASGTLDAVAMGDGQSSPVHPFEWNR